jgi:hypothetical protein
MHLGSRVIDRIQSGITNCGPLFLTFPTILSTAQIFNASSGQGLSIASNSNEVFGELFSLSRRCRVSAPGRIGQVLFQSPRIAVLL